jgi:hypothetical protein
LSEITRGPLEELPATTIIHRPHSSSSANVDRRVIVAVSALGAVVCVLVLAALAACIFRMRSRRKRRNVRQPAHSSLSVSTTKPSASRTESPGTRGANIDKASPPGLVNQSLAAHSEAPTTDLEASQHGSTIFSRSGRKHGSLAMHSEPEIDIDLNQTSEGVSALDRGGANVLNRSLNTSLGVHSDAGLAVDQGDAGLGSRSLSGGLQPPHADDPTATASQYTAEEQMKQQQEATAHQERQSRGGDAELAVPPVLDQCPEATEAVSGMLIGRMSLYLACTGIECFEFSGLCEHACVSKLDFVILLAQRTLVAACC